MICRKNIIDNVLTAAKRQYDQSVIANVERWINEEYFYLCKLISWQPLRTSAEFDFTEDDDDTGLWLPSDLMGIDAVRDEENYISFMPRDYAGIEYEDEGYRFSTYYPSATAAFYGTDCHVARAGTTFTSASLTADGTDYTDDYVRFGIEPGYYKLTASTTFTPAYYGPDLSEDEISIRPPETMKMQLWEREETLLTDRTVRVHYWRCPTPLYRDSDVCVLPSARPLELRLLIRLIGDVGKRQIATDRYRAEYEAALAECKRLNPEYPRENAPRDRHNSPFTFATTGMYQRRY